jgi:hypothetical protein
VGAVVEASRGKGGEKGRKSRGERKKEKSRKTFIHCHRVTTHLQLINYYYYYYYYYYYTEVYK